MNHKYRFVPATITTSMIRLHGRKPPPRNLLLLSGTYNENCSVMQWINNNNARAASTVTGTSNTTTGSIASSTVTTNTVESSVQGTIPTNNTVSGVSTATSASESGLVASTATSAGSTTTDMLSSDSTMTQKEKYEAYMDHANNIMKDYHATRELMKQGKLVNPNNGGTSTSNNSTNNYYYSTWKNGFGGGGGGSGGGFSGRRGGAVHVQVAIISSFLVLFFVAPAIGKKIASDDEFRTKYIPSWYDFTVKKPESAWTRQELHEQMVSIQRELRERTIAGEFTPDNIEQIRNSSSMTKNSSFAALFEDHQKQSQQQQQQQQKHPYAKQWEQLHPGLEENEKYNESE